MPGIASLIDSDYVENSANGMIEYQYTEVYQVIASNTSEGPDTIVNATGIPSINTPKVIGSTSTLVWCIQRHPRRQGTGADRLKWYVTCSFTNLTSKFERDVNGNPIDDPIDAVPRVDFAFQETYTPIYSCTFRGMTDKAGSTVATLPPWLAVGDKRTFIHNSAGDYIDREKRDSTKIITVRKVVRSWNNSWDTAVNTVNSGSVTISQSDSDGTRLSQTFTVRQLLLADVVKQDVWRQGKLYFDVGFVLYYNANTWRHYEPDAGTRRWVYSGQYKNTSAGTQYAAADFTGDLIDGMYQEIPVPSTDGETVGLVGQPVALNGFGMEIPTRNADIPNRTAMRNQSFTLAFDIYSESDFSALGIT